MKKVRLGNTNLRVSEIGFGGIPITRISKRKAVSLIRKALDRGINFIDSAVGYQDSEEKIGAAVSRKKREAIILATKSSAREGKKMIADVDQSLKRLKVDYIDLYQCHGVNDFERWKAVIRRGGALDALKKAKKEGKIRHVGMSAHSLDVAREAIKARVFETVQIPFNFVTNEPEKEILPLLQKHPVGLIVMKPFAGGMLSSARLAIKYLAQFPGIVPIPGFETEEELMQVIKIVEAGKFLTAAEKKKIRELRKKLGKVFCRRCGYCLPCPQEINIQLVLNYRNFFRRFPEKVSLYGGGKRLIDRARQCIECGDCETRCPYQLPIRKMLKDSIAYYDKKLLLASRKPH